MVEATPLEMGGLQTVASVPQSFSSIHLLVMYFAPSIDSLQIQADDFQPHFKMLLPLTRTSSSTSPSCLPTSFYRVIVLAVTWRSSSSAIYLTTAPNWVSRPRNAHGSGRPGVMQARPYLILQSCTRCHNIPQTSSQTTTS